MIYDSKDIFKNGFCLVHWYSSWRHNFQSWQNGWKYKNLNISRTECGFSMKLKKFFTVPQRLHFQKLPFFCGGNNPYLFKEYSKWKQYFQWKQYTSLLNVGQNMAEVRTSLLFLFSIVFCKVHHINLSFTTLNACFLDFCPPKIQFVVCRIYNSEKRWLSYRLDKKRARFCRSTIS